MIVIASTLHATFRDTRVPSVRFAGNMELAGNLEEGTCFCAWCPAALLLRLRER